MFAHAFGRVHVCVRACQCVSACVCLRVHVRRPRSCVLSARTGLTVSPLAIAGLDPAENPAESCSCLVVRPYWRELAERTSEANYATGL
eukprot:3791946-Alexandrium_andersonii.AAC.1